MTFENRSNAKTVLHFSETKSYRRENLVLVRLLLRFDDLIKNILKVTYKVHKLNII